MADPLAATLAAIVASQHSLAPVQHAGSYPDSPAVRDPMYAAQIYDAFDSADSFRRGGRETNPLMQPFSHGGAPTMLAGFALGDLLRNLVLRHASTGTKNTADLIQMLLNLQGITQTNHGK